MSINQSFNFILFLPKSAYIENKFDSTGQKEEIVLQKIAVNKTYAKYIINQNPLIPLKHKALFLIGARPQEVFIKTQKSNFMQLCTKFCFNNIVNFRPGIQFPTIS